MSFPAPEMAPDVLRWVEEFSASLLAEDLVSELADELNASLMTDIPAVAADLGIRADLDTSTDELLRTFLAASAKDPLADIDFPPATVDLARTLAHRGHDVGTLLRMYRTGQRVFWSRLMTIVSEQIADPDLRMQVLQFMWDRMSRTLERNLDMLVGVHTEEREQQLRGVLHRRAETVQAILRGDPVEVDPAAQQLGHNLHRHQTALVLWAAEPAGSGSGEVSEQLETLAAEAAALAGAAAPLTIRSAARTVWAWLATGPKPRLERIGDAPQLRQSPQLRVAVGAPARGLQGFRDSHREALRAQAVAAEADRSAQVTHYRDVEILSFLTGEPDDDALRALVARELGDLAGSGESLRRLRATAQAYLQAGGSARAAAEQLGVHKNTVLYRLRQVDELLGHPIDERRLPLEVALLVADAYGLRVLQVAASR